MIRNCVICGKEFDTVLTGRRKCCSKECMKIRHNEKCVETNRKNMLELKNIHNEQLQQEEEKRLKEEAEARRKKSVSALADVNSKARALGLSYGQYQLLSAQGKI